MALCILIKFEDEIHIGENIRIVVYKDKGGARVRLAIDAPKDLKISHKKAKHRNTPET